jgi:hypothetical protein
MSDDLSLPCDVELPYSIPAACQQEPDALFDYAPSLPIKSVRFWVLPKDNCLPSTAKAILDLDRPKLSDKQEREGQGISRAVDRLNSGDHRYGFNEWRP